jgi:pimeloyl-ACP methyl ester carboxylesterase
MTRFTLTSLLSFLLYSGCHWKFTQYRRSDESYKMKMLYPVRKWSIVYGNAEGIKLRFISVGDTSLPVLVLVHGSPGSIVTFEPFLMDTSITNHVRLIAMDRPGYGYSGLGKPDTSILHQADLIYSILHNDLDINKYSVMGYSYGGSVAATLAAIDNKKVKHLVLVSASLEPGKEKTYKISHVIKTKVFGPLCPKVYRSANKEKLSHHAALSNVTGMYPDI